MWGNAGDWAGSCHTYVKHVGNAGKLPLRPTSAGPSLQHAHLHRHRRPSAMASGLFGTRDRSAADASPQAANRDLFGVPVGNASRAAVGSTRPPPLRDTTHSLPHVQLPSASASLFDVGIFRDTLAPSLALHSGFAVAAWAAARALGRVEAKDLVWPSGQVVNAWWSAVGRRVFVHGFTVAQALGRLSWHERLVLSGVSLWGGRLLYRIASRAAKRGADDPRYDEAKKEDGFWNRSLFTTFIPEALFQMVISLPFTAPFRHEGAVLTGYHPLIQMAAVGMFSTGFALETLADYQLDTFKAQGTTGLMKDGVWSIVRHPK